MLKRKIKVTYFGNKLSKHGKSKAVLETLEPLFAEFCDINSFSDVRNKFLRMLDMIINFFIHGLNSKTIIIDVYSTSNFYFAYILSLLSILFKKQYILFLHGGNLPFRYKKSKSKINYIFKNAKSIVAPSNYLKSFFETAGFQVNYIPNIIKIQDYRFKKRTIIKPRLLYTRGYGEIYNPQMTIRAIALLREQYPGIRLTMIGGDLDGGLQKARELIQQLDLEKNIQTLGKINREEWLDMSVDYDIMVSNPVIDNTPISVIEGMALGLLIISTDVGGISFLLSHKEDALLVPSDDHHQLASAVTELIENHDLSELMQANARKKAEEFSWENVKPSWMKLILN